MARRGMLATWNAGDRASASTSTSGASETNVGNRASASTSGGGTCARNAVDQACASTSASGASARSAELMRPSQCHLGWRTSSEVNSRRIPARSRCEIVPCCHPSAFSSRWPLLALLRVPFAHPRASSRLSRTRYPHCLLKIHVGMGGVDPGVGVGGEGKGVLKLR